MGSSSEPPAYTRKMSVPKFRESFELQTIHEDREETTLMTELDKLKTVTKRLALATTRPSIVEWRANLERPLFLAGKQRRTGAGVGDCYVERCLDRCHRTQDERREDLQKSIDWIKDELAAMKSQDHVLAMQLMRLRSEIQQLRLQRSISEHRELIENAAYNVEEELERKTGLCDTPLNGAFLPGFDSALKDFGVTRMNLNARRFSLR